MTLRPLTSAIALAAAAGLTLAGCSADAADAGGTSALETITIGYVPSWSDGKTSGFLLGDQFEKLGYEVEMESLTEAAVLYTSLAEGDIDVFAGAWPERTQAAYLEGREDAFEDLGTWYERATITLAVPDYVDVRSLEELADESERFDGRIVGIEPSAGQMEHTEEVGMPAYGLDEEFSLVSSSTAAMLGTLSDAVAEERDIVVTSWRPFWANEVFGLRDLEDPQGVMGEPEGIHVLATTGFSDRFPEAAEYASGFALDDRAFGSLENLMTNEFAEGEEAAAVDAWLAEHPDALPGGLSA
ncbi:glycine betaine ABC transporter substrate-binding protein [Leucobacter allii]|uniref:glycine betaine ABC transporter substrate-binding protein n=1 Tax=Leucobacter allii TaxID=2932247 RepID=UPI001FD1FADD|nr:glycine betaine ABC transporter substrate-binding protein [Leucobacter allii]UOR03101.1 glycine betaine ABC transporter substrate-binding protein [Leucobacter allii]